MPTTTTAHHNAQQPIDWDYLLRSWSAPHALPAEAPWLRAPLPAELAGGGWGKQLEAQLAGVFFDIFPDSAPPPSPLAPGAAPSQWRPPPPGGASPHQPHAAAAAARLLPPVVQQQQRGGGVWGGVGRAPSFRGALPDDLVLPLVDELLGGQQQQQQQRGAGGTDVPSPPALRDPGAAPTQP